MKKTKMRLFAAIMAMVVTTSAFAQSSSTESNKVDSTSTAISEVDGVFVPAKSFWHNWYLGVGAGANIFHGESDRYGDLSGRVDKVFDVSLGKWFLPSVGARLQFNAGTYRGYINNNVLNETATSPYDDRYYNQKWNYIHFHGDMMFDLTNAIWGYKQDRFYSFIPYWGLGMYKSTTTDRNIEITANVGAVNTFRLSPAFDLNLEYRATLVNDRFDTEVKTEANKVLEGASAVTIGIAYNFKPRGWEQARNLYVKQNKYKSMLAAANAENAALKDKLNAVVPVKVADTVEVVKDNIIIPKHAVQFIINRTDLSKMARVNLGFLAEVIKQTPSDKKFKIAGYADKQTGNPTINQRLSIGRAEAVRDCLVKEFGVDPAKLVIEYHGGVGNMFYDDNKLSRATIMEMVK